MLDISHFCELLNAYNFLTNQKTKISAEHKIEQDRIFHEDVDGCGWHMRMV